MTNRYTRGDWKRLGTAVQAARTRRKADGLDNTAEWADEIGRSSRILLGLERGEPAGAGTLRRIEQALRWPPGYADRILADPSAELAPEEPRPLAESINFQPPPRPLDDYTTAQLLEEVENRFAELALEVHSLGRPAVNTRKEDFETLIEPMSPAQRRALRTQPAPKRTPEVAGRTAGTDGGSQG